MEQLQICGGTGGEMFLKIKEILWASSSREKDYEIPKVKICRVLYPSVQVKLIWQGMKIPSTFLRKGVKLSDLCFRMITEEVYQGWNCNSTVGNMFKHQLVQLSSVGSDTGGGEQGTDQR